MGAPSIFVVDLHGEIDLPRARELSDLVARFEASVAADARIDLRGVTFMNCIGISFLYRLARTARSRGGMVEVIGPQPQVARVLRASRIDQVAIRGEPV